MGKIKVNIIIILLVLVMVPVSCDAITGALPTTTTTVVDSPSATAAATTSSTSSSGLFKWTVQTGELGAALEENEPETFAGCWREGAAFVIAFTSHGEETIRKYVEEDSPLDNSIVLRTFDVPYRDLLAAQQETMNLLDSLDLFFGSSVQVMENIVDVYVTDTDLLEQKLAETGFTLPEHVRTVVIYEPLREPPFEVNPPEGIHFPQLKMASGQYMMARMTGVLEIKNGYLYVNNNIIIWQPDYFLTEHDGIIEVLDREGRVVGRVGEEIIMGGGGVAREHIERMLKEPLPADSGNDFFLQGTGTKLGLNFNSELFGLQVLEEAETDQKLYFLTQKPSLTEGLGAPYYVDTCQFIATLSSGTLLKHPRYKVARTPGDDRAYTLLWPEGFRVGLENGKICIFDGTGNVVVRDREYVFVTGDWISGIDTDITRQLYNELPPGMETPYYFVLDVIPWQPDPEIVTTTLEISGIQAELTAPGDVTFSDLKLEPGVCPEDFWTPWEDADRYKTGDPCLVLTGTITNMSPNRFEIAVSARGKDAAGEDVTWTLDRGPITGATTLRVKYGESATFVLHLNPADDLVSLQINVGTSTVPFP